MMENEKMNMSIIMIGRNTAGYVRRSFERIIPQLEKGRSKLLYVDDCSDDGSVLVAKSLATENVEVVQTPSRMNIGGARNFGLSYLMNKPDTPSYVWFNDSDDYITDHAIGRILEVADKNHPDCISIPVAVIIKGNTDISHCQVKASSIEQAPFGPVGEWAQVFRPELYVQNPVGQACEDAAWHFMQFDRFETWGKVEGDEACYVWDNTNPRAITRTVEWCARHSITLESAAFENLLVNAGMDDRWISDNLRNIANMYDARNSITKPWVRAAWAERFRSEVANMMSGHHIH